MSYFLPPEGLLTSYMLPPPGIYSFWQSENISTVIFSNICAPLLETLVTNWLSLWGVWLFKDALLILYNCFFFSLCALLCIGFSSPFARQWQSPFWDCSPPVSPCLGVRQVSLVMSYLLLAHLLQLNLWYSATVLYLLCYFQHFYLWRRVG